MFDVFQQNSSFILELFSDFMEKSDRTSQPKSDD